MAGAIWFLIKILIEFLTNFVIVYKGEVNAGISINMIFLGHLQGFDLLVGALCFKLD